MTFSFLHISDIHLGRPFSGLSVYSSDENIIKIVQNATENALENAISFAIEKKVDFVLISGDTFDSCQQDFNSKLVFKTQLKRLESANIKTYVIAGNHDPITSFNKNTFDFDENSFVKIVGLNTGIKEKFILNNADNIPFAVVQAVSYKEKDYKENILDSLLRPTIDEKKLFNIALLHCDLDGVSSSDYAPCNSSDLLSLGFDYYSLGHIHIPTEHYAGTIQGRNTKETGIHGFKYIVVDNNRIKTNELIPCDVVRYEDFNIDLSETFDSIQVYELILDTIKNYIYSNQNNSCELYLFRFNLVGLVPYFSEINEEFFETIIEKIIRDFNNKVCISKIYNNTSQKIDVTKLKDDTGIIGELYSVLTEREYLDTAFKAVKDNMKKILPDCEFSDEEFAEFKSQVYKYSTDYGINLCNIVYNNENEEV